MASQSGPSSLTPRASSTKPVALPRYTFLTQGGNKDRVFYIRDDAEADTQIAALDLTGPLGFDLEWKPAFKKGQRENPTALVQLASEDTVLLLQVSGMKRNLIQRLYYAIFLNSFNYQGFPRNLRELLGNGSIVKCGVGIQNDAKKLFNDFAVPIRNCVDLSLLARCADNERWKGRYANGIALARLVDTYKHLTLSKGAQTSNWEAVLTPAQQAYAANDAHCAVKIYDHLQSMLWETTPIPGVVHYAFSYVQGRFCDPPGTPRGDDPANLLHVSNAGGSTAAHQGELSGKPWTAQSPANYDPGPPPEPREPRLSKPDDNGPTPATASSREERGGVRVPDPTRAPLRSVWSGSHGDKSRQDSTHVGGSAESSKTG